MHPLWMHTRAGVNGGWLCNLRVRCRSPMKLSLSGKQVDLDAMHNERTRPFANAPDRWSTISLVIAVVCPGLDLMCAGSGAKYDACIWGSGSLTLLVLGIFSSHSPPCPRKTQMMGSRQRDVPRLRNRLGSIEWSFEAPSDARCCSLAYPIIWAPNGFRVLAPIRTSFRCRTPNPIF